MNKREAKKRALDFAADWIESGVDQGYESMYTRSAVALAYGDLLPEDDRGRMEAAMREVADELRRRAFRLEARDL